MVENRQKHPIQLSIISLVTFDVGKAYLASFEIAKETDSTFLGIFVWSLSNPNRDAQYLSFLTEAENIDNIIEKIKSALGLESKNVLFTITPTQTRPAPTDAIR